MSGSASAVDGARAPARGEAVHGGPGAEHRLEVGGRELGRVERPEPG